VAYVQSPSLHADIDPVQQPDGVVLAFDGICYHRKWYQFKPKADIKHQPRHLSGEEGEMKLKPLFIGKDETGLVYWQPELPDYLEEAGVVVVDSDSPSSEENEEEDEDD
jgi:hypothetical protein